VVASLLRELKVTAIHNDIARGSIPPAFLTFHKKGASDLWCTVEKGQCLGTRGGEIYIRDGFIKALNKQLTAQEKHAVNVMEFSSSVRKGAKEATSPPPNASEPDQKTKERRAMETAKLVTCNFPAFLKQVLNLVAHYRQGNNELTYCLSAVESRPIIDELASGKIEALDWTQDRWKKELEGRFQRGAGSFDLTPGLGFYLMIVFNGGEEILVFPYGKLTFEKSPLAVFQKAIAGRQHKPETIQLLPR
jgi:hypothetical protein